MKKLTSIVCMIVLILLNFSNLPIYAADFSSANLTVSLFNEQKTNLYHEGDVPSARIKIYNNQNIDLSGNYICSVKNPDGTEVLNINKDITVPENTDKSFSQVLDVGVGVYTLNVVLNGDFGGVSRSIKFTVLKKNNIRNNKVGTCLHFDLDGRDDRLDETHSLTEAGGIGWVRDDLRWERMQSEAGGEIVVPAYRDEEINAHIEAGNKVLLVLAYGNSNYGNRFPKTDEEIIAYAAYCKAVAAHFKGKVDAFEIYNEPDYAYFAQWDITGADYVKVLKAATEAIREVQPNATIVGGALCTMSNPNSRARTVAKQIFEDPLVTNYMDAFSFHSYDYYSDGAYSDENKTMNFAGQIKFIEDLLINTNNPNLPIWITEDGIPSEGSVYANEIIQAEDTARALAAVAANSRVEKYFIYNLHEKTHSSILENSFGLVDENYEPKPVYSAVAFSNKMLTNVECVHKFEGDNTAYSGDALGGYGYKTDDKDIYVAWAHTGKTASLKISKTRPAGAKSTFSKLGSVGTVTIAEDADVTIYDMYGKRLEYTSNISLSSSPIYVEIESSKTKFERSGNIVTINGCSDLGNCNVTLIAREKENPQNILALKQIKSNELGEFKFSVEIPAEKNFYIYVFDGNIKESANYGGEDLSVVPHLFVNQCETYNLNNIKNGDTVTLKIDAMGTEASKCLIFYGAVYKNNGVLLKADRKALSLSNGIASAQIEFFIENEEDIQNIKYMLWNENMSPLTDVMMFE